NINVNGDITAGSADYLKGTYAYAGENANLSVVATGTISGSIGADISGDGANTLSVQAKEIKGDNIGVFLYIRGESDSNAIVTADTISGKNVSIGLSNYGGDQSNKNSTIIAWKIELNNRGNVAENADLETLEAISVNKNFELNNILYLLKIEQPAEGGTISLESDDESVEETGLANETAKVYVKVNIQEGYAVAGVYNGKDEKKLISKDDKGYYIVVPKGGGVYLTADIGPALKIIDETKDPHEIGGGQSHFVEVNANINDFKQVILDNVDVTKHATVTEGSTIVTFDPSFLDTLSVGEHDLMLKFRIGIASTKLRVIDNNPDNNPSSDSNNTGFAIPKTGIEDMQKTSSAYKGYMIASFAVAAAIVTFKRNRKNLVK
ncbi:MAG: hypothetical protein IKI61_09130, partial [Erysipelotrichaceae bacterium]|nr:hypothetical protein [Erysipelotrichaceae bacterium]